MPATPEELAAAAGLQAVVGPIHRRTAVPSVDGYHPRSPIPVKRLGEPKEIASMVSWLASNEGGYATGAEFSVNGGQHMQ